MIDLALNVSTIVQVLLIGAIGAHIKAVRDLSSAVKIIEFRLEHIERSFIPRSEMPQH